MKPLIKSFEIWVGKYCLDKNGEYVETPIKIGEENSTSFKIACLKYKLKSCLKRIENFENMDTNIYHENLFKPTKEYTGKYYKTEKEAIDSFERCY